MSFSFSDRINLHTPNISVAPESHHAHVPTVMAVSNQLLIAQSNAHGQHSPTNSAEVIILDWLNQQGYQPRFLTTLFDQIPHPSTIQDVAIYEVVLPPGMNIFSLTAHLRMQIGENSATQLTQVSPNHVLVPAFLDHGCPYGSPKPLPGPPPKIPPKAPGKSSRVTVIDSGYQWNDPVWNPNPLTPRLAHPFIQAERLPSYNPAAPPTVATPAHWADGVRDVPTWAGCPADKSPETIAGALVTLAGHANFIAGVIAQVSETAVITIRNHNGFDPSTDDLRPKPPSRGRSAGLQSSTSPT